MTDSSDPVFDRSVFIVSPSRAGSTLPFETLVRAPLAYIIGSESRLLNGTISPCRRLGRT